MSSPVDAGTSSAVSGATPPLRIGLLLDSFTAPAWVARVVDEVQRSGVAEVTLVVMNETPPGSAGPGRGGRVGAWVRNRRMLPYALLQRAEARYVTPTDPFALVDLGERLAGVPVVTVRPRQTVHVDYFPDEACDAVEAHALDVALRFGFRILRGRALSVAREGVWSFHHGDNRVNRGGPAGFWEVAEGHEVTGAVLQRLTDELDGGVVLARSRSSTDPISVAANRANFYWQSVPLVVRELRRLYDLGPERFAAAAVPERDAASWSAYGGPLYRAPEPAAVGRFALARGRRKVRRKVDGLLRREQWLLGYHFRGPSASAGPDADVPSAVGYRFREIVPPRDRYWADPFPVHVDGRYYVFFEEHLFGRANAHIAVLELDRDGPRGAPRTVLARDHHLSYPNVFAWEGAWYMMPETLARRAVEVYRAAAFPDRWEHHATVLDDVDAVDPTLAHVDGRWWLFVGVQAAGGSEANALHLYHGPTPLGPWTPHRRNPVKVDVCGARPAGRLFTQHGVLYRPGQVGAPSYGRATAVFRVDRLTPDEYAETEVSRLDPLWRPGLRGTHTLNAAGGLTTVDLLHAIRR